MNPESSLREINYNCMQHSIVLLFTWNHFPEQNWKVLNFFVKLILEAKSSHANFFSWNQFQEQNCGIANKYPNFMWKRFTVWKNTKLSLTKKIFREINSLVTSSKVKPLLSRNLCQKCVREFSFHTHTVEKREILCQAEFFSSNQLGVKFFS